MKFYEEKDLGLCGLACVLCSQEDCPGCKAKGLKEECGCSIYKCASEKGLDGCYECSGYPCSEKMHQGTRGRAFNQYAGQYGKSELLSRLRDNYDNGISYHMADGSRGDYDLLDSNEDIMRLISYGIVNPYVKCPVYETEHFIVRLIAKEDAPGLLKCYSDQNAQPVFNSDSCTGDFFFSTIEEMEGSISMWLESYARQDFVRFSIIDKKGGLAAGTIEMFGKIGSYKTERGILRLDIASEYEQSGYLNELFSLCIERFFMLFDVNLIVTKAVPSAGERIKVLESTGFKPYSFPEREHYWGIHAPSQKKTQ